MKKSNIDRSFGAKFEIQGILVEAEISSHLKSFVNKCIEIAESHPRILEEINHDLDLHGLKKKAEREADRNFFREQNPSFEGLKDSMPPPSCSLELEPGRPRMPAIVVFVLLLLRGRIGGPKSSEFQLILRESITLRQFFDRHGCKVPGASTVADNINAVRISTLRLILPAQLEQARILGLDNFETIQFDSTAVHANSKYPTDSGLMAAFAMRIVGLFKRLSDLKLGLPDWLTHKAAEHSRQVAEEIDLNAKYIGMLSGKRNATTQRKVHYAKIYTRAARLSRIFKPIFCQMQETVNQIPLPPSKTKVVSELFHECIQDLESIHQISAYSRQRIFREKQTPSAQKVHSVSDADAAIIRKGGREDVFGYRPQLVFSGKGLITVHRFPRGNAADSGQLRDILEESESNTGVIPKCVTGDDGYTNSAVRNEYLIKHKDVIEVFSFSGSKGRKAIGEEVYESEMYRKARKDRSAVESRIFTLKFNHGYEDVMRRGQDNVEHEQLTKCLAYNMCRIVWLKKAMAKAEREAALKKAA